MQPALIAGMVLVFLFAAVCLGMFLRRLLPEHHLGTDTRDVVKLAVGMVATMSALLIGLLISSAHGSYNTLRSEVIQMSAKIALLDRALELYGPEAAGSRAQLRAVVEDSVHRIWPDEVGVPARLDPNISAGDKLYVDIQRLAPRDDTQRSLKEHAGTLIMEIAQLRSLLQAQAVSTISKPLLTAVVCWLVIIFLGFSVLAPQNATATLALLVSAFSVAGAVFLILEFDQPFGGLVRISSEPMQNVLKHFAK